ncbi:MAG: autorepressor SdpR family transcription factor [Armatimonadetes bacterium]|nr:autorepressor SdpR family transcription factor [Armatimonadota bacterium]MDW8122586.1 autorepressor SdpR family transcription factor [Armatimonadota bacterium]
MDAIFRALSDPTRRKILKLLSKGEMTAGELAEQFPISAPSMSYHFNILKQSNLVATRKEGQQVYYSLNTTVLQDILLALMDLFGVTAENGREEK